MFVHVLLAHQAKLTDGQPVVGGEKDPGVVRLTIGFERLQDAADLGVEVGDEGVVFAPLGLDGPVGSRERSQPFVAQRPPGAHGLRMGVFGQGIDGHGNPLKRIAVQISLGRLPGIVGALNAQ